MIVLAQEPCYCPLIERIAGGGGGFAVGGDFSFGDRADDAAECGVARLVFAEAVLQNSSLEVLGDGRASHEVKFIRVWLGFVWLVGVLASHPMLRIGWGTRFRARVGEKLGLVEGFAFPPYRKVRDRMGHPVFVLVLEKNS